MTDPSLIKGYRALKVKNLKRSHTHFSSLLKRSVDKRDRYGAMIGLSLTLRELGDTDEAISILKKAIKTIPQPLEALYNLGNLYEESGQHALAIQNYDLVISIDPDYQDAYLNRGVCWYNLGKYDDGINDFKNAMKKRESRSKAYSNVGIAMLEQHKFEPAIDNFDRSLEMDPENIHSLCGKGLALYNMDRYDESIICFDAAISINPEFYIAHYYKGHIMRGLDLIQEAEEAIMEALEIRLEYPLAWFELGEILRNKQDIKGSINAYGKAIKYHEGTYEEALFQKARLHLSIDETTKAISDLKKICRANPNVGKVWLEMGKALLKKSMDEKARKAFENAYFLLPSNPEVIFLLSRSLISANNKKRAKKILESGMERTPDPRNGLILATLQKELNEPKDAILTCEEVLSTDPEKLDAWLIMGRSYGMMGKTEEYKQCLRKYLHKRPGDEKVENEMASIGQ